MNFRYRYVGLPVLALIAIIALLKMFVIVDFGTVQLQTEFGALTGVVYDEGFHLRAPWQGVVEWNIKTLSYETSSNPDESDADFTDFPVDGLTNDGQQVLAMRYTVLFSIDRDCTIKNARQYGSMNGVVENVVKAHTRNLARVNLGRFPAEVLASDIAQYENAVIEALNVKFSDNCVKLEGFLARKPDLDPDYLEAIEDQQIAQENIQTAEYQSEEAEFRKDIVITEAEGRKQEDILEAEGRAQATVLQATAEAEAIRIRADAEAYATGVQGAALQRYPSILSWEFVQALPDSDYMILPDTGVTPLIPLPPGTN